MHVVLSKEVTDLSVIFSMWNDRFILLSIKRPFTNLL